MKSKLLVAACALLCSSSAFAQFPTTVSDAGVTVAPWPFKQTDNITITVDATKTYPRATSPNGNEPMKGAASCWIHGGVNLGTIPPSTLKEWWTDANQKRWQNVQGDWRNYPAKCQFKSAGTDKYTLAMVPATFYSLGATDKISELNFVLNDGNGGKKSGGTAPDNTNPDQVKEGRTDYFVPLDATTTGVHSMEIFSEARSYPNPATEYVNISVGLKNSGALTLKIFDSQGREVKTLVQNAFHTGNTLHIFSWDATNNTGVRVGNGAYFYRAEINGFSVAGSISISR